MPAQIFATQSELDKLSKLVWTLWNRDLRNTVINEGGIKVFDDGVLVGTVGMIGETIGLGYQYDGAVTSAAAVAAIHKATLGAHATDLASQLGSINYLNEQKNLHAATLAAHGTELSSQAGSILSIAGALNGTNGRVDSLETAMSGVQSGLSSAQGALSSLQSTVGGQAGTNSGFQSAINNLVSDYGLLAARISRLESWARNGGGPGGPPFNDGA